VYLCEIKRAAEMDGVDKGSLQNLTGRSIFQIATAKWRLKASVAYMLFLVYGGFVAFSLLNDSGVINV